MGKQPRSIRENVMPGELFKLGPIENGRNKSGRTANGRILTQRVPSERRQQTSYPVATLHHEEQASSSRSCWDDEDYAPGGKNEGGKESAQWLRGSNGLPEWASGVSLEQDGVFQESIAERTKRSTRVSRSSRMPATPASAYRAPSQSVSPQKTRRSRSRIPSAKTSHVIRPFVQQTDSYGEKIRRMQIEIQKCHRKRQVNTARSSARKGHGLENVASSSRDNRASYQQEYRRRENFVFQNEKENQYLEVKQFKSKNATSDQEESVFSISLKSQEKPEMRGRQASHKDSQTQTNIQRNSFALSSSKTKDKDKYCKDADESQEAQKREHKDRKRNSSDAGHEKKFGAPEEKKPKSSGHSTSSTHRIRLESSCSSVVTTSANQFSEDIYDSGISDKCQDEYLEDNPRLWQSRNFLANISTRIVKEVIKAKEFAEKVMHKDRDDALSCCDTILPVLHYLNQSSTKKRHSMAVASEKRPENRNDITARSNNQPSASNSTGNRSSGNRLLEKLPKGSLEAQSSVSSVAGLAKKSALSLPSSSSKQIASRTLSASGISDKSPARARGIVGREAVSGDAVLMSSTKQLQKPLEHTKKRYTEDQINALFESSPKDAVPQSSKKKVERTKSDADRLRKGKGGIQGTNVCNAQSAESAREGPSGQRTELASSRLIDKAQKRKENVGESEPSKRSHVPSMGLGPPFARTSRTVGLIDDNEEVRKAKMPAPTSHDHLSRKHRNLSDEVVEKSESRKLNASTEESRDHERSASHARKHSYSVVGVHEDPVVEPLRKGNETSHEKSKEPHHKKEEKRRQDRQDGSGSGRLEKNNVERRKKGAEWKEKCKKFIAQAKNAAVGIKEGSQQNLDESLPAPNLATDLETEVNQRQFLARSYSTVSRSSLSSERSTSLPTSSQETVSTSAASQGHSLLLDPDVLSQIDAEIEKEESSILAEKARRSALRVEERARNGAAWVQVSQTSQDRVEEPQEGIRARNGETCGLAAHRQSVEAGSKERWNHPETAGGNGVNHGQGQRSSMGENRRARSIRGNEIADAQTRRSSEDRPRRLEDQVILGATSDRTRVQPDEGLESTTASTRISGFESQDSMNQPSAYQSSSLLPEQDRYLMIPPPVYDAPEAKVPKSFLVRNSVVNPMKSVAPDATSFDVNDNPYLSDLEPQSQSDVQVQSEPVLAWDLMTVEEEPCTSIVPLAAPCVEPPAQLQSQNVDIQSPSTSAAGQIVSQVATATQSTSSSATGLVVSSGSNATPAKKYRGCRRCRNHGYEVQYHRREKCPNGLCDCRKCKNLKQKDLRLRRTVPAFIEAVQKACDDSTPGTNESNRLLPVVSELMPDLLETLATCANETSSLTSPSESSVGSPVRIGATNVGPSQGYVQGNLKTDVLASWNNNEICLDQKPLRINNAEQRTLNKIIEFIDLTSDDEDDDGQQKFKAVQALSNFSRTLTVAATTPALSAIPPAGSVREEEHSSESTAPETQQQVATQSVNQVLLPPPPPPRTEAMVQPCWNDASFQTPSCFPDSYNSRSAPVFSQPSTRIAQYYHPPNCNGVQDAFFYQQQCEINSWMNCCGSYGSYYYPYYSQASQGLGSWPHNSLQQPLQNVPMPPSQFTQASHGSRGWTQSGYQQPPQLYFQQRPQNVPSPATQYTQGYNATVSQQQNPYTQHDNTFEV